MWISGICRNAINSFEGSWDYARIKAQDSLPVRQKKNNPPLIAPPSTLEGLDIFLAQLETETGIRKASYDYLSDLIKQYQTRFTHTPSITPLSGRLSAGFGWRRHPIFRTMEFHQGLDVMTWYGAPIRAAADGVVEKADWNYGYGKAVIIDHGYGIKTLYGHLSRFLVRQGMTVRKGQWIAEAGSTGISTGVHLHYELRKEETATSPVPYLNMDMLTAIGRWR